MTGKFNEIDGMYCTCGEPLRGNFVISHFFGVRICAKCADTEAMILETYSRDEQPSLQGCGYLPKMKFPIKKKVADTHESPTAGMDKAISLVVDAIARVNIPKASRFMEAIGLKTGISI